jgi:hypothetical protein
LREAGKRDAFGFKMPGLLNLDVCYCRTDGQLEVLSSAAVGSDLKLNLMFNETN